MKERKTCWTEGSFVFLLLPPLALSIAVVEKKNLTTTTARQKVNIFLSMGNTASQVDIDQDKLEANGSATKRNLSVGDLNQYQKDPAFLPDKTETWVTSKDQDGWVLSHNSLRGELEEMRAALNAISTTKSETTTLEAWKLKCLQSIWKYHVDHVVLHQKAEEEVLQPFLETRVKYPTQVSEHGTISLFVFENDRRRCSVLGARYSTLFF